MSSGTLATFAKELLKLGQKIEKISRSNSISNQTFSTNRRLTNDHLTKLIGDYNTIAKTVSENSEHSIDPYVISEYVNSHEQVVLTASNKK